MNNETPKEAAHRLAVKQIAKGFQPIALHLYADTEGKEIYWRIRLKHPVTNEKWIRPFYRNPQGKFVLGEPAFTHGKPLYGLSLLRQYPDETVWIVEGEACADHLLKLGLMATTSGSADSATTADWTPLAGRKIIIWPDHDKAGLRYAQDVTRQLHSLNCTVQWIEVMALHLRPKEDCVDWLQQHPHADRHAINALPTLVPSLTENKTSENKSVVPLFKITDRGVFYMGDEEARWICSKLEIKALVRDKASENWGRLIEFCDADGQLHTWAMPMEMLKGSCEEVRGELMRLGLEIAPGLKTRNLLIEYMITARPEARARCVTRTGWHPPVFVLPPRTFGETTEQVIYQAENQTRDYQQSGTLAEWQTQIAALCIGNSRLVLTVSMAFAALLLHPAGMESGGIHLVGVSSSGKTTVLRVAASVYGAPDYLHRWRATTNGLEALAALRSDTLLVLDELAQVDAKEAGEIAYMLANGSGKARATRQGTARSRYEWRLLFLSAGEIGLAQHIREAGKKARVGQEVRLVDLPADTGKGLGIFEHLHHAASSAELSQRLLEATTRYYGVPAIAFLERIFQDPYLDKLATESKIFCKRFAQKHLPAEASGQVHRVCERFALIAFAGELATTLQITGWPAEAAAHAAGLCFNTWLEQRGGSQDQERATVLSQVRGFLEAHGESRFTEWGMTTCRTVNRAGFRKTDSQGTQFYVLSEAFRHEVCAGLDYRAAARLLLTENWLLPGDDGLPSRREYLPNLGRARCYVLTPRVWEG